MRQSRSKERKEGRKKKGIKKYNDYVDEHPRTTRNTLSSTHSIRFKLLLHCEGRYNGPIYIQGLMTN